MYLLLISRSWKKKLKFELMVRLGYFIRIGSLRSSFENTDTLLLTIGFDDWRLVHCSIPRRSVVPEAYLTSSPDVKKQFMVIVVCPLLGQTVYMKYY